MTADHTYLIALGSNIRVTGIGGPAAVLDAAVEAIDNADCEVLAVSFIISSRPLGPSARTYANAAALVASAMEPPAMLAMLQTIESRFGRQRRGARWQARTLDLDIVLWSGGVYAAPDLLIPHPEFRSRSFVLGPAAQIAPDWSDPVSGKTLRQLYARLTRRRPLPRGRRAQATETHLHTPGPGGP
ncbi:2-amino-4-hydroxy-6-hydroxymethyldihydropteridine diphosphokinase [Alteripontixanthobacter maritimus]|uniref:2-amino-4-hydroxy-6- hydroxymethyldihydropteridine diphosphokinase n=1 Tax=Alteripontixanthobacter maritimus TaxID=2161824 RepID=UPI000E1C341D|nr:2-amino-4-hydroxy-6-hydroxymethyldihydropteridine diphosphokinase [Alteripontixanthobacter maritimus]